MPVMTVLLRTYRSLSIRDLPSTTARSRLCRPTRRAKSSTPPSTQEPPSSASKGQSNPPKPSAKAASLENVEVTPIDIPTSLWYQRLGPVSNFFRWFHRTQEKRPYTVQISTSLTVYLFGDLLAQDIGGENYDPRRTLRMLTIGAIASVPGYKWLCEVYLLRLLH
jgi:protein Mpv17